MTKTRLFFVIDSFKTGGAQQQLLELIRQLDKDRYEIVVNPIENIMDLKRQYTETGVQINQTYKRYSKDLSIIPRVAQQMREFKPDIVHTWLFSGNFWGRLAAMFASVPIVIGSERTNVEAGRVPRTYKWSNRFLSHWTSAITVNSHSGYKYTSEQLRGAHPPIYVIHNAVDSDRFNPFNLFEWRVEMQSKLNIPADRITIGNVGRLEYQKGQDDLIYATHQLHKQGYNVQLVIVGEGSRFRELQELSITLGMQDRVFLAGRHDDMPKIYSLFDVFAFSSYYEGLPNAVLEAMSMQRPIVATDTAGTSELIVDNETGLLVPPKNHRFLIEKIGHILDNYEFGKQLGFAARQRAVNKFGLERMMQNYVSLYNCLLKSNQ